MSHSLTSGRGGIFCRFTIGAGERGASARHLRYIANPQAVREGREGVWLKAFPDALEKVSYPVMVQCLLQYADGCEREELIIGRNKNQNINQRVRTHYSAILSFEAPVSTPQAKETLSRWIGEAFPKAQAAAFLHRNTQHLHLHVWIAARQTDGRKINLSARAFRQLDETWNRIYSEALNRDEREHLLKKGETEKWKELRRERPEERREQGKLEKPERVAHGWNPALFNERERERSGGNKGETGKGKAEDYDVNEKGVGGDQYRLARGVSEGESRGSRPEVRDPSVTAAFRQEQKTVGEAQRAVSELARLYSDVERMGELRQGQTRKPIREVDIEREE